MDDDYDVLKDEVWGNRAYLLEKTGKYTVKLKPEVVKACKQKKFEPWAISDAEALLQQLFGAKKLSDDFYTIFGDAWDYNYDTLGHQENIYEISDPVKMEQWMTEEDKKMSITYNNNIWRFSLQSDPNGQIVGFYCPLICCHDLMGYILLFCGWNLSGDNFKSYLDLEHIDFLVRKGLIEL